MNEDNPNMEGGDLSECKACPARAICPFDGSELMHFTPMKATISQKTSVKIY